MTTIQLPPSPTGGDLSVALPVGGPTVLVSSRDNVPVPAVRGAQRLAKLAEAHGWQAVLTYACAQWPDRFARDGGLRKAKHEVHTVAVRITRDGKPRGFAVYERDGDEGAWRFRTAVFDFRTYNYRSLSERLAKP